MSLFFERRAGVRGDEERAVRLPGYAIQQAEGVGFAVDADSAMRHDTVWSCRTRIAQDVSMMPVDVGRYVGDDWQDVARTPQIIAAPSAILSALDWRYQVIDAWLSDGNAWGLVTQVTPDGRYPQRIELRSHRQVRVDITGPTVRFYVDNEEQQLWPVGKLWHVPAYTAPGNVLGLSPIAYHATTIGAGIAAEQFGSDFFMRSGHPSAILAPDRDPGPEGSKALKRAFLSATRGREPAVLPQSVKYQPVQVSPTDSQFIDTMRYTAEQICRIYGEDPADHGVSSGGSSVTYANRIDADLARFKRRQFWVTKLQQALTDLLPRPQIVRLNVNASLMMTPRERHELYKLRLDSRTLTINEVRRIEDETPFSPDFDEPGIPPVPATPADPAANA